jgi:thiol-disulfide isomerase/thioredoxin
MVTLQGIILSLALTGAGDTVLLDFSGDGCPHCRQMDPTIQQLTAAGYPVRRVDVNREPALARRFGVSPIPCFVMLVDGREVDRVVGATSMGRLQQMLALGAPKRQERTPVQWASAEGERTPAVLIPSVPSGSGFSASVASQGTAVPGWRYSDSDAPPAAKSTEKTENDLIAATVRLRIQDPTGQSVGSGTIIDARQGMALVLTCAHLFRDSHGKGRIEADLFGPHAAEHVAGQMIHYDLDRDVALLSIHAPGPVTVARVAPGGFQPAKGARVFTVGCNNGDPPTLRQSHITSLDKFGGTHNVEVAGLPVQGRSGGGVFTSDGRLIGVCNAAVPGDNEGLYAALAEVHAELDYADLAYVYRNPDWNTEPARNERPAERSLASANAASTVSPAGGSPSMPKEMPPPSDLFQLTEAPRRDAAPPVAPPVAPPAARAAVSADERAALEEIERRRAGDAEVICIIRSRSNPAAQSEIIVIDKASPSLLQAISGKRG